jgi:hypothetical protein
MIGPLPLQPIVDRIRAQVPALAQVERGLDLGAVQGATIAPPAAFVLQGTESAIPRTGASDGRLRQRITATIGVVVAVQAYGTGAGAYASTSLETLLASVRGALLNWRPTGADSILEFAGGQTLGVSTDGLAMWLDRFRCDYWIDQ